MTFLLVLFTAQHCLAQKPPQLGYLYPPVIQPGQASEVQLGGFDLTSDVQWFVHGEGLQLNPQGPAGDFILPPPPYWFGPKASSPAPPIPRELPAMLRVPAETPDGLYRWQVANANGISDTAVFFVSRDTELIEQRSRDFAQTLPVLAGNQTYAVSGRLSRISEVDRYVIESSADTWITIDVMARRLGADINGVIEVHDVSNQLVADFSDSDGLDGSLSFPVKAAQRYTISFHDVDFRGDQAYVYRLAFASGPRILTTIPSVLQPGVTTEVTLIGYGLDAAQDSAGAGNSLRQDTLPATRQLSVSVPADFTASHSEQTLQTSAGTLNLKIPVSSETQVNVLNPANTSETSETSTALPGPCRINGVIDPKQRAQAFSFSANAGEHWKFTALSRGLGSRMDLALELRGPDGKVIAENDDFGGLADPTLRTTIPAPGTYTIVARGLTLSESTLENYFQLQIEQELPNYSLSCPQQILLPTSGKVEVPIQVSRIGGWDGDIQILVAGLPNGVAVSGDSVIPAGKNDIKLVLEAAADAATQAAAIQIKGAAVIGDAQVERTVLANCGGNLAPNKPQDLQSETIMLCMTLPAPFDILVVDRERQRDVNRGTTYRAELDIVRKPGFTGPIQITMSAKQDRQRQGVRGPTIIVPPNESKAWYPCFLPEWLSTDLTRRIVVHGIAEVPDPQGNLRQVTKAGDARITMIMEGALLKLKAIESDLSVTAGYSVELPFEIARSAKFAEETRVELIIPDEAKDLLSADAILLSTSETRAALTLHTKNEPALLGPWRLTLRATSLQGGQWPVVSEADVLVEVVSPN